MLNMVAVFFVVVVVLCFSFLLFFVGFGFWFLVENVGNEMAAVSWLKFHDI